MRLSWPRPTALTGNARMGYHVGITSTVDAEVTVNRKNPGLAELEPITKEEEHNFYRYHANGWTIAAFLYTAYGLWQGVGHHFSSMFGWLMTAVACTAYWYESRKNGPSAKL